MYRIMKESGDVAIVEQLVFIRRHDNGSFVQTDKETAQGIAIKGIPYNLLGAEPLDDDYETVWPVEINGGEYILEHQTTIDSMIITMLEGLSPSIHLDGVFNAITKNWITAEEAAEIIGDDTMDILEILRAAKLREISKICESTIAAGIDVTLDGETSHFSLTSNDQINLTNAMIAVANGASTYPYHNDGALYRLFGADEITSIGTAATQFILYHTSYCNHLNHYIRRIDDVETLAGIFYSSELPVDMTKNIQSILGQPQGI